MVQPSFGHDDDPVMKAARRTYRVRPTQNDELFTESAVKFAAKTFWARVTTPRSVDFYRAVGRQFVGIGLLILATIAAMVVWVAEKLGELGWSSVGAGKQALKHAGKGAGTVGRGLGRTGRGLGRGVKEGAIGFGEGVGSVGRGVRDVSRGVAVGVNRGVEKAGQGAATVGRGVGAVGSGVGKVGSGVSKAGKRGAGVVGRGVGHGAGSVGRGVGSVGRGIGSVGLSVSARVAAGATRVSRSARAIRWTINDYRRRANAGVQWLLSLLGSRLVRLAKWNWKFSTWAAVASARGVRRHHYAVTTVSFSVVLLLTAPVTGEMLSDLMQGARVQVSSLTEPVFPIVVQVPDVSIPEVKIPSVSFHKPRLPDVSLADFKMPDVDVPDLSIQWPAFVTVPIKRLDEMLSGPLVEPGSRVLVADFDVEGIPATGIGQAMALVVEAELSTARRFTILPRERVLAASAAAQRSGSFALDAEQAIAIAAAGGEAAVVSGRFEIADGAFRLDLSVLDAWGDEVYQITSLGGESEIVDATVRAARDLRRRLGEPDSDGWHGQTGPLLSSSIPALTAYTEARFQLWRGRYWATINSAAAATRVDTAFAAAHHLSATAYALVGQRWRALQALESAWQYRGRLSERERLRLAADREVFRGRLSQAIADYDMLFSLYRNDVAALKSQAIVQRMIGARGHGTGNLHVAYSIDPVDWPPLRRIARFLGYSGRLPSIDQFAGAPVRTATAGPSD